MFLAPMLLVIHHWKGLAVSSLLWLIGAGGLYWFWYRNLPARNFYDD